MQSWYDTAVKRVEDLFESPWYSFEPPNELSKQNILLIIKLMCFDESTTLEPERILRDAEGGFCLRFVSNSDQKRKIEQRFVSVDTGNDGCFILSKIDNINDTLVVEEVNERPITQEMVSKILRETREFLGE